MAINTAVNTANLANKAAQVGYAQNVSAPKELKRTEEPRQIKDLDEEGLDTLGQTRETVEDKNLEDSAGVNRQRTDAVRRDEGGRRQVQGRSETGKTAETGKSSEAKGQTATQAEGQAPQTGDVATRPLRLALSDNSKQLQAQFDTQQAQQDPQQKTMGPDARRTVMLRNMQSMVNTQLAQYTGNEPYTRSNYRQILGALTLMQGGGSSSKTQDGVSSDNNEAAWGTSEGETDGTYKLYSGQAAKVLEFLAPKPERAPGDEPLELVA